MKGGVITGQVSRQSTSYRQGLVLGLTMAEVMLLLIFCLLIALGVLLAKEKAALVRLQEKLEEANLARSSNDHLVQMLDKNRQLHEALQAETSASDPAVITEFWRKLVDSKATVDELEKNGVSRSDLLQSASYLAELKKLRALGIQPADL